MRIAYLIIILLLRVNVSAQDEINILTIEVVNKSGVKLQEAIVQTKQAYYFTDSKGKVVVTENEKDSIRISHLGYYDEIIPFPEVKNIQIQLEENTIIAPVVITNLSAEDFFKKIKHKFLEQASLSPTFSKVYIREFIKKPQTLCGLTDYVGTLYQSGLDASLNKKKYRFLASSFFLPYTVRKSNYDLRYKSILHNNDKRNSVFQDVLVIWNQLLNMGPFVEQSKDIKVSWADDEIGRTVKVEQKNSAGYLLFTYENDILKTIKAVNFSSLENGFNSNYDMVVSLVEVNGQWFWQEMKLWSRYKEREQVVVLKKAENRITHLNINPFNPKECQKVSNFINKQPIRYIKDFWEAQNIPLPCNPNCASLLKEEFKENDGFTYSNYSSSEKETMLYNSLYSEFQKSYFK